MTVREPPDRLYAELFEAVQSEHLFGDSKTFVDATARSSPPEILTQYRRQQSASDFDLAEFVNAHFTLPADNGDIATDPRGQSVEARIDELWDLLARGPDEAVENSSLIPLPNRYVVPGGRFREVYYWDSYFTMLGLAESGRVDLIREMVENFAYLIDLTGFIPNGNRTYYCTRSQPPFFALMIELLAEVSHDDSVYGRYRPQLEAEYRFWMSKAGKLNAAQPAERRVVKSPAGLLNRYWDDAATPRQESFAEDVALAANTSRNPAELYRDIRAGAESGWDYSSRWFADGLSMQTIRTTQVVPVDLNALMYKLETTLAHVCELQGDSERADVYASHARNRKQLLQTLFFDHDSGMFVDLALPEFTPTGTLSLASMYPLFFGVATEEQARSVADRVHREFLKPGGWVTTNVESGQQWDSPNGWAPLQWVTYVGLSRYGYIKEARDGAKRWVDDNLAIYQQHGRLLEKYNVKSSGLAGTGGEYEVQDGFGWTNAVLKKLLAELS